MDKIAHEILDNYETFNEDNRLNDPFGQFEKLRTQELILEYCPDKSKIIYDIGGATGAYSFYLSDLGYKVKLIDIVPKHIEIAKEKSKDHKPLLDYTVADARDLPFDNDQADIVILHGPLYHFENRSDRIKTLKEAYRILRPNGLLLAFTITRYAGINYGLSESMVFDDEYFSVIKNEILTGIRDNNSRKIRSFLKAYFHLPYEIENEIKDANFNFIKTIGILGTAWHIDGLKECLDNTEKRNRLLEIAKLLENEPILSPRMLSIAIKK